MRSYVEEKYWFSNISNDYFLILSGFFLCTIDNTQGRNIKVEERLPYIAMQSHQIANDLTFYKLNSVHTT
jgi:hypothetical protein